MSAYLIHLAILWGYVAISAMALNLLLGCTGIINLGHQGLVALGAYTSAILTTGQLTRAGTWNFYAALALGMAIAAGAACLLGLLTDRVRGDALSVILLGFTFTMYTLALNLSDITRGSLGIPGIPRPPELQSNLTYMFFVLGLTLIVFLFLRRVLHSPFGRVLAAVRDDELHARVLGVKTFRVKLIAMALSGALAGLAGGLEAQAISFINPQSFYLVALVFTLSVVYVGGLASLPGTLLGTTIVVFLPEVIRTVVNVPDSSVGALRGMLFSALLLIVVLFRPRGLLGRIELPAAHVDRD